MKNRYIDALTTWERIETLRKKHLFLETDTIFLDRWHHMRGLSSMVDLEFLLKLRGMSLGEFAYAIKPLNKVDEKVLERSLHDHVWYIELDRILNEYAMNSNKGLQPSADLSSVIRPFLHDFAVFFEPFKNEMGQANVKISDDVTQEVMQQLALMLSNIVVKVVSVDFTAVKTDAEIQGVDEKYLKERYGTQEQLHQFYADYPVMTRLLTERLITFKDWVKKGFLSLIEQSEAIKEEFNVQIVGNVMREVEWDVDLVQDGVCGKVIYTFEEDQKVVYEPRHLEIERRFYEFVKWINGQMDARSEWLALPISTVLYQKNLTLRLLVQKGQPESEQEVRDDYQRLGQLAVILYLLGAHEISYENVVARPSFLDVDVETLFQLDVALELPEKSETAGHDAQADLHQRKPEQMSEAPWWLADFKEGLRVMSDFILDHQAAVVLKMKDCFMSEVKVRQHLKAPIHYLQLIQFMNHPNYLKEMFYLEKLLDNTLAYPYQDKRVCAFEIDAMRQGQVPRFYTELGRSDVMTARGELIADYLDQTPFDQVMSRLETWDVAEIETDLVELVTRLHLWVEKGEVLG